MIFIWNTLILPVIGGHKTFGCCWEMGINQCVDKVSYEMIYIAVLGGALGMHNLYLFPCQVTLTPCKKPKKGIFLCISNYGYIFMRNKPTSLQSLFVIHCWHHVTHQMGLSLHSLSCLLCAVYLGND